MYKLVNEEVVKWCKEHNEPQHAVLCDPPYEISFMNKKFDSTGVSFRAETWSAIKDCLLPGAFGMAFGGTRSYHRMACAIEDAGFVIHPAIGWCFATGFPKATRIDTQIEGEIVGINEDYLRRKPNGMKTPGSNYSQHQQETNALVPTNPKTWVGHRYGLQALKPAFEFICVFQKPYEGRPIDCITETGAGALNIDGCRIGYRSEDDKKSAIPQGRITTRTGEFAGRSLGNGQDKELNREEWEQRMQGRWPSNLVLSEEVLGMFPETTDSNMSMRGARHGNIYGNGKGPSGPDSLRGHNDSGSAARFFFQVETQIDEADPLFYCSKASRRERDLGCEEMEEKRTQVTGWSGEGMPLRQDGTERKIPTGKNIHPCCKPTKLTEYLSRLLLPPKEYSPRKILIPFFGSGSEMIGAYKAGWEEIVGIELDKEYVEIAESRMKYWTKQTRFTDG
jgi:hypothetical protein